MKGIIFVGAGRGGGRLQKNEGLQHPCEHKAQFKPLGESDITDKFANTIGLRLAFLVQFE